MEDIQLFIKEFIVERYRANRLINLMDESAKEDFSKLPREWVLFCWSNRDCIQRLIKTQVGGERMAAQLADASVMAFAGYNQFVQINGAEKKMLIGIYIDAFNKLKELLAGSSSHKAFQAGITRLFRGHFALLQRFAGNIRDARLLESGHPVICGEYGPKMQLSNLAISVENLMEPVLDLGCGMNGDLVFNIRESGMEASGIDRFARPRKHLTRVDWLRYDFPQASWGTIISHISFSNHFIHHHLRKDGRFVEYGRKYIEILQALKLGGAFVYAPNLPFIENILLPEHYRIIRHEVPSCGGTELLCGKKYYAAHVQRLN